ncbi:MAG: GreA/GreB family elongation factor, partial [Patescibacteria group bacterium]
KLIDELQKVSLEGGKNAQEDRGIFSFEEYERQKKMLSVRIRDLISIKNQACIVEPQKNDVASLGSIITVRNETDGATRRIKIGSYMVFTKHNGEVVSHDAPLAKIFIGGRVGDVREGEISNKKQIFKIIKIEQ